jgi:BRCT domain type II-containing protein
MITPGENYEQDQIRGNNKQTVILDEAETAETDGLDPKFYEGSSIDPISPDPDKEKDDAALDGEKIYNEPSEPQQEAIEHDTDLNHNSEDDLSINKPADDIF